MKIEIIPVVIGAMGTIPKRLDKYLKDLGIQDSVLICTGKILRNVLSLLRSGSDTRLEKYNLVRY